MNRDASAPSDPYCYAGSVVLINKLGITDYATLQSAQFHLARKSSLAMPPVAPTEQGIRDAHLYLYGQLYSWAGQNRLTELQTGGIEHAKPIAISTDLAREFAALRAANNLKGLQPKEFADQAAERIGGLSVIAPFREGNGVVLRHFAKHLAGQAGHEFQIRSIDPQAWAISKQQSAVGNFKPLSETIRAGLIASPSIGIAIDNTVAKAKPRNRDSGPER